MPIVSCPACQKKLAVKAESFGKAVRCPKCESTFTPRAEIVTSPVPKSPVSAPASPVVLTTAQSILTPPLPISADDAGFRDEPLPPDDEQASDEPVKSAAQAAAARRWTTVRGGLRMVWLGVLFLLVGYAVRTTASLVDHFSGLRPAQAVQDSMALRVGTISSSASVWGFVIAFVGICMACAAPDPIAARLARIGVPTIALAVINGIAAMSMFASSIRANPARGVGFFHADGMTIGTAAVALGLFLVGYVCWIVFHAAVGRALDHPKLTRVAYVYLAATIILPAAPFGSNFVIENVLWDAVQNELRVLVREIVSMVSTIAVLGGYLILSSKTISVINSR